jgi:hypothetical protein
MSALVLRAARCGALLLLLAAPALAQRNHYVDPVNGNDTNPGTASQPVKSVSYALRFLANDGDSIHCAPGRYSPSTNGDFTDPSTGLFAAWVIGQAQNGVPMRINLIGAGAERCIVDPEGQQTSFFFARVLFTGAGTKIKGFTFQNPGQLAGRWNCAWRLGSTSTGFTVDDVEISECIFRDLPYAFVSFGASLRTRFHDNVVINCADGIGVTNFSAVSGDIGYIYNNTFQNIGTSGIEILADTRSTSTIYIFNNSFVNVGFNAIWFDTGFGTPIVYSDANNFWQVGASYGSGLSAGASDSFADPLLVSPADYRLQPSSPLVDSGSNTAPAGMPLPAGIYPPYGNDVQGGMRLIDGDLDGAIEVDRGAEEVSSIAVAGFGPVPLGSTATVSVLDERGDFAANPIDPTYLLFGAAGTGALQFAIEPFGLLALDLATFSYLTTGSMPPVNGRARADLSFALPNDPFLIGRRAPVQFLVAQIQASGLRGELTAIAELAF